MISRRYAFGAFASTAAAAALLASTLSASATPGFPGFALSTNGSLTPAGVNNVPYSATQSSALTFTVNGVILTCAANSGSTASGTVSRGTYTTNQAGVITATKFGSAVFKGDRLSGAGTPSGSPTYNVITPGATPCTTTNGTVPVAVVGPEGAPVSGGTGSNTNPATSWPAWTINVTGVSTTQPNPQGVPQSGQVTPGSIENIRATVYVGRNSSCHFEVAGVSTNGSYTTSPDNSSSIPGGKVYGTYTNNNPGSLAVNASDSRTQLRVWNVSNPTSGCVGGLITNGQSATFGGTYNVNATTSTNNPIWVRS